MQSVFDHFSACSSRIGEKIFREQIISLIFRQDDIFLVQAIGWHFSRIDYDLNQEKKIHKLVQSH